VGTTVALDSQSLLVSKRLRQPETGALATASNASMQGVGTELGTLGRIDPWVVHAGRGAPRMARRLSAGVARAVLVLKMRIP
jgi:hypothetical protein